MELFSVLFRCQNAAALLQSVSPQGQIPGVNVVGNVFGNGCVFCVGEVKTFHGYLDVWELNRFLLFYGMIHACVLYLFLGGATAKTSFTLYFSGRNRVSYTVFK